MLGNQFKEENVSLKTIYQAANFGKEKPKHAISQASKRIGKNKN
jgi:hypothetical protein